jgi:hypothetical protein
MFHRAAWLGSRAELESTGERMANAEHREGPVSAQSSRRRLRSARTIPVIHLPTCAFAEYRWTRSQLPQSGFCAAAQIAEAVVQGSHKSGS